MCGVKNGDGKTNSYFFKKVAVVWFMKVAVVWFMKVAVVWFMAPMMCKW